jgi:hypothetical protein
MPEHSGKKKRKATKRAAKEAARAYQAQAGITEGIPWAPSSTDPAGVEEFLQAYAELTDATVELYKRLDSQDPRHQQVREALAHAQGATAVVLGEACAKLEASTNGDAESEMEADDGHDLSGTAFLAANGSVELVRIAPDMRPAPDPRIAPSTQTSPDKGTALDRRAAPEPPPNLPAVIVRDTARRWLPDQSFLVRYARVRRATHRWPDEAALTRYLRGRQLPDESGLRRFIHKRRELYRLYGSGKPR